MSWLIATKLEMTRIVKEDRFIPITLLQVPKLKIAWIKTCEKDWYNALIVWVLKEWIEDSILKEWKRFLSLNDFIELVEFEVWEDNISNYNIWDNLDLSSLDDVKLVTIEWISKWKWFAWAMKRHNFHWGPWSHGSKFHRALWSIGNRKPRRTHKWKKMHGHMWLDKVTIKKVSLELVNKDISVIWVRWWVPWSRNSLVKIIF